MMLADSRQFSSPNYENAGAFAQGFHFSFPCADGLGNDAFVFRVEVFGDAKQHVLGQVFAKELQQSIGAIGVSMNKWLCLSVALLLSNVVSCLISFSLIGG